jgi:hypothetical protein
LNCETRNTKTFAHVFLWIGIKKPKPSVTEHGVSVLPPTMGGFKKTKEEQALGEFLDSDLNTGGA